MYRFLRRFAFIGFACLASLLSANAAVAACATNEIDVLGDGTQCETTKFSVTTTTDATTLNWTMTATGPFYVDCGDGGTLTQSGFTTGSTISGNTITRTKTGSSIYTCTWGSAGEHTVRFGGTATGYSTSTTAAAIAFYRSPGGTQAKVASISGSLGAMFPVVNRNIPRFYQTFYYCSNLTSIPADLFSGIDTSSATNTSYMFYQTFGYTGITSLPAGLFSGIDTSSATNTNSMFYGTFSGCRSLTSIPADLFSAIDTSSATDTRSMFSCTFQNTSFASIPAGLFSAIDTSRAINTNSMFYYTFFGAGITSIPVDLFSAIDTSRATNTSSMFYWTFSDCTSLGSIPADLFSAIDTSRATNTSQMFDGTFRNCSNLGGYIPPTTFPGTIQPGSSSSTQMWVTTFYNTQLLTVCPAGTTQYITGFESDWGYNNGNVPTDDGSTRVSCEPCAGTIPEHASYVAGTCDWACDSGYINTGTSCETAKFSVTTTTDATKLVWTMTAKGPFYVDCGDGGTLTQSGSTSGSTISGNTITRTNVYATTYTCTWGSAGAHTVRFGGTATGYSTSASDAAISFSNGSQTLVASIDGSLGAMFPVIGGNIPRFYRTFHFCSNLTSIPAGLFSGIDTSSATDTNNMFGQTFDYTGLTSIPAGLFSTIDTSSATNTSRMFYYTFDGCRSLTSIPGNLFSAIDTSSATNTSYMFMYTFNNCSSLTGNIPAGLFSAIDTSSATNTSYMFNNTFDGCSNLTGNIPAGLFNAIDTSSATNTSRMFYYTFSNCSNLTGDIPAGLFSGIDTSSATDTSEMFESTFSSTGITSIPAGLFSAIDTSNATNTSGVFEGTFGSTGITSIPAELFSAIDTSNSTNTSSMFRGTFYGCSNLTNIPAGLFSTIDTSVATNTSGMFYTTFYNCSNLSSIPADLFSAIDTSSATNTSNMFYSTFGNCSSLSSIPAGLFSTIDTSSATDTRNMFNGTFYGCTNLTGYIPPTTFPNTIRKGTSSSTNMWNSTFYNTQLLTACPAGTTQYITGFESDWNGKVSCEPCPGTLPEHASYTTAGTCDWACDSGYMNIGTSCETAKFSVTTTSDATTLSWTMTASGTFYVDCGDGGTLTQSGTTTGSTISGNTITRTRTGTGTPTYYTCRWNSAGAHTVRFGGTATGYRTSTSDAAIAFYKSSGGTQAKVASISGSLGAMFPVVNGNIPRFYQTFYSCSNLTSIPTGLFSGIDTSSATNISDMFYHTFYNTGITSIPTGLFSGIDTSSATNTSRMFVGTFRGTGITSIPTGLFSSIDTSSATNTNWMFLTTFYDTGITSIPADLFSTIDTSAAIDTGAMFAGTFANTGLTSIPAGLFSTIDTSSATDTGNIFDGTFSGCGSLTSIPAGLFSTIDTSSATDTSNMFYQTFYDCSNLGGYIPPTTFPNTIRKGTLSNARMWQDTFVGTNIATSCDSFPGMTQYITGFESEWGYSNNNVPTDDGSTRVSCQTCAEAGMPEYAGKCRTYCSAMSLLHAGNYEYRLLADRTGVPAPVLALKKNDDVCYLYMEQDDNLDTEGLHIKYDNHTYSPVSLAQPG